MTLVRGTLIARIPISDPVVAGMASNLKSLHKLVIAPSQTTYKAGAHTAGPPKKVGGHTRGPVMNYLEQDPKRPEYSQYTLIPATMLLYPLKLLSRNLLKDP